MKKIFLVIFILIGLSSSAQDLTCKDFREGTFIVPASDSLEFPSYKIIRKGDFQTESVTSPKYQQTIYVKIKWIDNCSYRSTYDSSKMKLTEYQKLMNTSGGILVEIIKIKERCSFFKSTLTINGKTQRIDGQLCKE